VNLGFLVWEMEIDPLRSYCNNTVTMNIVIKSRGSQSD